IRWIGIGTTFIPLILSAWVYAAFDVAGGEVQFTETLKWIQIPLNMELVQNLGFISSYTLQFDYALAADGISMPLVFLTALIATMAAFASVHIKKRFKTFFILFLLLE